MPPLVIVAFVFNFPAMPIDEEASVEFHIPANDALGRQNVDGKVRFADKQLFVHWKLRNRTFTRTQNKLETVELSVGDVEDLRLEKGWFSTTLYLEIKDPRLLDEMPGVDMGKVAIKLPRSARSEAAKLISVFEFEHAEWEAEAARRRVLGLEEETAGDEPQ